MFRLSPSAGARIAAILAAEPPGTALRVAVQGGGCNGFRYTFALDLPAADDTLIEQAGARVVIDPASGEFLAEAELDATETLLGSHFAVRNPLARSSCGCGASFSPD
jgi:iron-sulfur cluster assembly accessory protein